VRIVNLASFNPWFLALSGQVTWKLPGAERGFCRIEEAKLASQEKQRGYITTKYGIPRYIYVSTNEELIDTGAHEKG